MKKYLREPSNLKVYAGALSINIAKQIFQKEKTGLIGNDSLLMISLLFNVLMEVRAPLQSGFPHVELYLLL